VKVSVLVSITEYRTHIEGVFVRHEDAVAYADGRKVRGWHVYERELIWKDDDRNLLAEIFATALLRTTDESGDFISDTEVLADELGIIEDVATQVKALKEG
jgi:hypothetical protein